MTEFPPLGQRRPDTSGEQLHSAQVSSLWTPCRTAWRSSGSSCTASCKNNLGESVGHIRHTIILRHRLVPFLARIQPVLALYLLLDCIALGVDLGGRGRGQGGLRGVTQRSVGTLGVGQLLLALVLELGGVLQALLVVLGDKIVISERFGWQ